MKNRILALSLALSLGLAQTSNAKPTVVVSPEKEKTSPARKIGNWMLAKAKFAALLGGGFWICGRGYEKLEDLSKHYFPNAHHFETPESKSAVTDTEFAKDTQGLLKDIRSKFVLAMIGPMVVLGVATLFAKKKKNAACACGEGCNCAEAAEVDTSVASEACACGTGCGCAA